MITLTIIGVILLCIIGIILFIVTAIGGSLLVVFGDIAVALFVIWLIVKFIRKDKNKESK